MASTRVDRGLSQSLGEEDMLQPESTETFGLEGPTNDEAASTLEAFAEELS